MARITVLWPITVWTISIERVWGCWFEFGDSEVTEFTEAGGDWVGMIAQVATDAQGCRRSERHVLLVPDSMDVTNVY